MNIKKSDLETAFKLLDENCNKKLQELHLILEETGNNINEIHFQTIALNSEIIKVNQDISKYKEGIMQRKHNFNNKDEHLEKIAIFENTDKNSIPDVQKKTKNGLMFPMVLLQNEKEEKNTSNLKQEIVEIDVENKSLEWEQLEIDKKINNLQLLNNNYKSSVDNSLLENI